MKTLRYYRFLLAVMSGRFIFTMAPTTCRAFTPAPTSARTLNQPQCSHDRSTWTATAVAMGLFGNDDGSSTSGILSRFMGGGSNDTGPKTVLELPARDVKVGALRFLLNIVLVGEQNKPAPKSWLTKQGEGAGDLQVYYQDGTGMLLIELQEYGIKMMRHGQKPSLQYLLQESVLLHTVLDELSDVAFGTKEDGIATDKRLLVFLDENAVETARKKLPARQA